MSRPRALVRPPSPRLAEGETTGPRRARVDVALARSQWRAYVAAFRDHGWSVSEVDAADEHPDGVFLEDSLVVFGDLAVLTHPGAASRTGEVTSTARFLDRERAAGDLSLETARIEAPGHLDGGDVLKVGRTAYVGLGSRTNAAGIAQLRSLLRERGWTVVAVPVTQVLHLKSAVTALPDGTVIGHEALVDQPYPYPTFLAVPEVHGTAVVDLGSGTVLMSADAPRTAELLARRGLDVVRVEISEFELLDGCVTCLSVRLR